MDPLQKLGQSVLVFLLRTQNYLFWLILLVPVIVLVQFSPILLQNFISESNISADDMSQILSRQIDSLLEYINSVEQIKTIATMGLWAGVGLVVYFLGTFLVRFTFDFTDEVGYSSYIKEPASRSLRIVYRFTTKLLVMLGWIGLLYYAIRSLIPSCFELMERYVTNLEIALLPQFLGGFFGFFFVSYLCVVATLLVFSYEDSA